MILTMLASAMILAAAPADNAPTIPAFTPATEQRLPNGVIIASQPGSDLPLIGVQVFLPAGLGHQPAGKAGLAAVAAATVLTAKVEGTTTLQDAFAEAGGSITYTLDPLDTRFYLECREADFARLVQDFRSALARADTSNLETQRAQALNLANSLTQNPIEMAYSMVRQVNYSGNGFGFPDQGSALTLGNISRTDVQAFINQYQRANGTIVALEGAVTQADLDAARRAFENFSPGAVLPVVATSGISRTHQVVARRSVPAPWIAVAYQAPDQYSKDFATMLVIEALLGSGGDVHAFAFNSGAPAPQDYVGAYYQYEANPGSMIVFLGGESANLDQSVRDLESGIARLRGTTLSTTLIDEAKKAALGDYYMGSTNLSDQAWLLGRSAASPQGLAFENLIPQRILAVSSSDIRRVARKYLTNETIAVVLPQTGGQ